MHLRASGRKTIVDPHVATFKPSKLLKPLSESGEALFHLRIVFSEANQHTDAPHPLGRLRPCRYRPCHRAREPDHDLPPIHSITSSARASLRAVPVGERASLSVTGGLRKRTGEI